MQFSICFVKLVVIKKVILKVNTKILDHRKKEKKMIQTAVSFRCIFSMFCLLLSTQNFHFTF